MPAPRLKLTKHPVVVVPLTGWLVVSLVVATGYPDLGLNLVADALSLFFVVFVVDVALQQVESERTRPARAAAFKEAVGALGSLHRVLTMALACTADRDDIPAVRSYIEGASEAALLRLAQIMSRIRLSAATGELTTNGKAIVSIDWKTYLIGTATRSQRDLERMLPRYISLIDPELVAALRAVEDLRLLLLFGTLHQVVHQTEQGMWIEAIRAHNVLDTALQSMANAEGFAMAWPVGVQLVDEEFISRIESGEFPHSGTPMAPVPI